MAGIARSNDALVAFNEKRPPTLRWWIAAGTVHLQCQGIWRFLPHAKAGDDLAFAAWLSAALKPVVVVSAKTH